MSDSPFLGRKVRTLRRQAGLTQAALAGRLDISPSYLNLIEHDRRSLSAKMLLKIARFFDLDLRSLDAGTDAQLEADLRELFGDPLFADQTPADADLRELAEANPEVGRAILHLYHSYVAARTSAESLAERALDHQEAGPAGQSHQSPEQVSDLVHSYKNHFPELEKEAERVWRDAKLEDGDFFASLASYLEREHQVTVKIEKVGEMKGALRRFIPEARTLLLSEALRRGSRNFQLTHQIGLLNGSVILDRLAADPLLKSDEARALARVALANYFAGAVLMPYADFLNAAREERYDIDLLGHRFRASFEQVCHRFTTLRRGGDEGVSFHMVRIDIAGNISKRFSISGIRLPRFSGLCPLWNVHAAFLRPGMIRVQLSRMPDGHTFFSVARTVRKHRGGYHARNVLYAVGLGCDVESAKELVYADGVDLTNPETAVPVGFTCRLCERVDCDARALPSLQQPLRVDENLRGVSFYTPVVEESDR